MVGVPGKSKGCNTCRKRKIACSLEKPQCLRCVKSNRECGGYQREAIFVVDQATGANAADLPEKSHIKTYRRPVVPGTGAGKASGARKNSSSLTCAASEFAPGIEITSPAAFRQQFFCQFLATFVPDVDQAAVRLKLRTEETTWLVLVPDLPELTKALDTAILALSTARLGRSNNDQRLILESRRLYGEGLKDLQRALWDPKLMYRDETLAACMALGIYETLECPAQSKGGWVSHSGGCSRLVQLRGPKAHSANLGHYLFSSYRLTGIIQCIHLRRSSFLSDPEWKKIAWKGCSSGSFDQLLDILSLIPGIFEEVDRIGEPEAGDIPALFDILDRCWKMDASLQKFYDDLESTVDGPLFWSRLSTMTLLPDDSGGEKLFPVAYHFKDLPAAFTCMMYWMNLILLWRTMMEIYGRILRSGHSLIKSEDPATPVISYAAQLQPLEHRKDLVSLAKNICQTVEFCMQEDKRSQGPGALVIPLLMATITFRYSPSCQRELAWARAAMVEVSERGWRITTHLEP